MINRALIVREPHVDNILDGIKTWEMRSTKTNIRERIGLIKAGSGLIVGEVDIIRVQEAPIKLRSRHMTKCFHRVEEKDFHKLEKWKYAWVLANAKRYETPIPYIHPRGAVIWVKLDRPVSGVGDE